MKNSLVSAAVLRTVGAACGVLTTLSCVNAETIDTTSEVVAPVIAAQAAYTLQPAAAPAKAAPTDPDSFLKGWKGSIEGGINGSTGNSENFNVRAGLGAKRTTSAMETSAALTYTWATSEVLPSQSADKRSRILQIGNRQRLSKPPISKWCTVGRQSGLRSARMTSVKTSRRNIHFSPDLYRSIRNSKSASYEV
jgi:hypothetical protein